MNKHDNKIIACILQAFVLIFTITILPQSGFGEGAEVRKKDSWEDYKIILQRNIFSRQRGPRIDLSQRQQVDAPPPPSPESYHILKGIVQENGVFIAFIENTQRGQIFKVKEGDTVARGKIKTLNLDTIEYDFDGRTVTVAIGNDLEGGKGTITLNQMYELSQSYTPTTTREPAKESSSPPANEAEILKQLMERRRQQLGQ